VAYTNTEVAEYLQNIATAYEIKHKNRFRIDAYQNAADTISSYPKNIYQLWLQDKKILDDVPNIGPGIIKKLDYLFTHHQIYPKLVPIFKSIHPSVFTFTKINGIGPIIAHKLTQQLKFSPKPTKALGQLIDYAQTHQIQTIPGFGQKSESQILDNTLSFLGRKNRMPLLTAVKLADQIINYLHQKFPQTKFIPLGSLRRQATTIGDIDIAAASTNPAPILNYFTQYPDIVTIIAQGSNKASIKLPRDVHIDLMIKPLQSFGALLQHFTGSRQHNIILRKHALKLGYSLSEYGIKNIKTGRVYQFDSEKKFYNFLNLKLIPPNKRVGEDELSRYAIKHQKA